MKNHKIRLTVRWGLAWALLAPLFWADGAEAARKALVIGNAAYSSERPLRNPPNDADDMAALLGGKLGFATTLLKNVSKSQLRDALDRFADGLGSGDDVVFYYAGHAAEFKGENYLIPVGADIGKDEHLQDEAFGLGRVLDKLAASQKGLKLVILDACRDNPYPGSHRSGKRGLARVSETPTGTLIWYAAEPGHTADDGDGRNGRFTESLLKALPTPGAQLEQVFKLAARQVYEATGHKQLPWMEGVSLEDFYFASAKIDPGPGPGPVVTPPPPPPPPACAYCSEMVSLPAGEFWMGSDDSDPQAQKDEKPRHKVQVAAFSIGKYEVTQGQWRAVMGSNPSYFKKCGDDCPVEEVSYRDVQKYIRRLNEQTHGNYRLPTEAEWEYACRAGQYQAYCGSDSADSVAWNDENSGGKTHLVGRKQANHWGLYDMSGNVNEWTCSAYDENGYSGAELNCAAREPEYYALRGGAWRNEPAWMRAWARSGEDADWSLPLRMAGYIGFRLARTP